MDSHWSKCCPWPWRIFFFFFRTWVADSIPRVSDFVALRWCLRICSSNKFWGLVGAFEGTSGWALQLCGKVFYYVYLCNLMPHSLYKNILGSSFWLSCRMKTRTLLHLPPASYFTCNPCRGISLGDSSRASGVSVPACLDSIIPEYFLLISLADCFSFNISVFAFQ